MSTNLQVFPVGDSIAVPEEPTEKNLKPLLEGLMPVLKYELKTDPAARMPDPQGGEALPVQNVRRIEGFEWIDKVFDRHGLTVIPHAKTTLDKVEQFVISSMVTSEAICGSENRDAVVLVQHEGSAISHWDT